MRILLWPAHRGFTSAFVRGNHTYLLPALEHTNGAVWPDLPGTVVNVRPEQLRTEPVDLVIIQRPQDLDATRDLLGREAGADLPAIYLEHNPPDASAAQQRHPIADRSDIVLVHVTKFNELYWDNGSAPTSVVEYGIADPGPKYSGERPAGAVVVNDPARRSRVVGGDLLRRFADVGPVEMFGAGCETFAARLAPSAHRVVGHQFFRTQDQMHQSLARRRVYLHPMRWTTSPGLPLIEAMHLAMPVIGLSTTALPDVVPPEAGMFSTDFDALASTFRTLLHEPEVARYMGRRARSSALRRFGLARFLADWQVVLARTVAEHRPRRRDRMVQRRYT